MWKIEITYVDWSQNVLNFPTREEMENSLQRNVSAAVVGRGIKSIKTSYTCELDSFFFSTECTSELIENISKEIKAETE